MVLSIIIAFLIIPVIAVAGYEHYKILNQPDYNPHTTLLNYEVIGIGKNKLVLLHGLTGSLNYWKRSLENISKTHSLFIHLFIYIVNQVCVSGFVKICSETHQPFF